MENAKNISRHPVRELPAYQRKYRQYLEAFPVDLPDRTWPNRRISKAPLWCSVDLRDGNQALINPMNLEQKLEMFDLLVAIGFKEIEVGFPSAAAVEFEFARTLIEQGRIPDEVYPQVLTQSRDHLIRRTFESLQGAKRAVVHLYNSTSELQRRVVFRKDKSAIVDIATSGTKLIKELALETDTEIVFEYSPESFTGTEIDFAFEICMAVVEHWQPTPENKIILNLPATVEMATPNVYADQIEWFCRQLGDMREAVILSLHPHNDRGTGVAATELGLLAGADRVEGTLFGNGERTGNVDIVTLALNMFSQGVHPKLNLRDLGVIRRVAERCTEIGVHERHPYAGDLVFTAFSGSHQDAIRKGTHALPEGDDALYEVPYLPIDPEDIGREYEPIIRINSQSGKGGVAFVMETDYGFQLPKEMHPDFSRIVQSISDSTGVEVSSKQIWQAFSKEYLETEQPFKLIKFVTVPYHENDDEDLVQGTLTFERDGERQHAVGVGNGPIDACKRAIAGSGVPNFKLTHYSEHALSIGSDAEAASYIQIETEEGRRVWGVGQDRNTTSANVKALISAVNRAFPNSSRY